MELWKWWDQLPEDVQRALLVAIAVFGGTSASCRPTGPIVCDPPPPPSSTPMICDPPPPPSATPGPQVTATPTATPMICDPPPPPPLTVTIAPGQHFAAQVIERWTDASLAGAVVRGTLISQDGAPLGGLPVVVKGGGWSDLVASDQWGEFFLEVPQAGDYSLYVEGDEANAFTLSLALQEVVIVELTETWDESHIPLPLAEIRAAEITWQGDLTFAARSPWPGAHYRWSASGGSLIQEGDSVTWQPPAEPGRYLLQVVADWGRRGLAVDALVLVVEDDGGVSLGA